MRATNVLDKSEQVETPLGIRTRWRVGVAVISGLAALVIGADMYAHLDPSRRPDVMQQWIPAWALLLAPVYLPVLIVLLRSPKRLTR